MWCGIANGAEDVLIPEKYDYDEQKLINNIIASRKAGKKHHIIVNAEGIGHSEAMAKRIEAATGIETRATILGHMQRGGSPTCKDRVYASMMGALAVDLLVQGKTCRVVGYRHGEFVDFDINEAPVSYTHLDVYKRQSLKRLRKWQCGASRSIRRYSRLRRSFRISTTTENMAPMLITDRIQNNIFLRKRLLQGAVFFCYSEGFCDTMCHIRL